MARTCFSGMEFCAASVRRRWAFWCASMMGVEGRRCPIRVVVEGEISSCGLRREGVRLVGGMSGFWETGLEFGAETGAFRGAGAVLQDLEI